MDLRKQKIRYLLNDLRDISFNIVRYDYFFNGKKESEIEEFDVITSLSFDNYLALGLSDGRIKIYDMETKSLDLTLKEKNYDPEDTNKINILKFSNNKLISSTLNSSRINIWNLDSSYTSHEFEGSIKDILVLSKTRILINIDNTSIILFDIIKKEIQDIIDLSNFNLGIITPISENMIAFANKRDVIIFDLESRQIHTILKGHAHYIVSIKLYSPSKIITSSQDLTLKIWDLNTGKQETTLYSFTGEASVIDLIMDDRMVLTSNKSILIYEKLKLKFKFDCDDYVSHVALLPDNKLVSIERFGNLRIWNLQIGRGLMSLEHEDLIKNLHVLKNGKLVTVDVGGYIILWN